MSEIRPISPNPIPGDRSAVARAAREQTLREEAERDARANRPRIWKRPWRRLWRG